MSEVFFDMAGSIVMTERAVVAARRDSADRSGRREFARWHGERAHATASAASRVASSPLEAAAIAIWTKSEEGGKGAH